MGVALGGRKRRGWPAKEPGLLSQDASFLRRVGGGVFTKSRGAERGGAGGI